MIDIFAAVGIALILFFLFMIFLIGAVAVKIANKLERQIGNLDATLHDMEQKNVSESKTQE